MTFALRERAQSMQPATSEVSPPPSALSALQTTSGDDAFEPKRFVGYYNATASDSSVVVAKATTTQP